MIRLLIICAVLLASKISTSQGAELEDGLQLLRANNYPAANAIFLKTAKTGNPQSMYHLGRAYIRGWGKEKNPTKALIWLNRSYKYSSNLKGKAAYEIGRIYQMQPDQRDYKKAYRWFWLGLEESYGKGHVQLANFYAQGLGVKANKKKALFHLERAAKLRYPQSMLSYAGHLKQGDYGPADPREVDMWVSKAVKILERQARKGASTSCVRLGKLYLNGGLVAEDQNLARKWFELGKQNGSSLAGRYLAKLDK